MPRTVTLYMCLPRHQLAEPIDATPDMTLADVVRRSAHLHWLVASRDINRLDVCVGGVPRRFSELLGSANSIEVYRERPAL